MLNQEAVVDANDLAFALCFSEYREKNVREPVEHYTIHHGMLKPLLDKDGLLTGKRVLDLACGHGHYTRQLKSLKCDYTLGVDLSPAMINYARDIERKNPQGIEYKVANVIDLPSPEQPFDLVTGFYLFDYAQTRQELLEMVKAVSAQLADGRQFIGIIGNVIAGKEMFNQRKYGIQRETKVPFGDGPIPDGTEIVVTLYNRQDEPITPFINYHYSPSAYEQVFKEAGFKTLEWVPYQYDSNAPNRAFFDDLINHAPSIGMVATK